MAYLGYRPNDVKRRFFPLPNEIFTLDLCAGEIAVYAFLMYRENRKTYQCHPSLKTIGNATGMTKNTVKKYISSLEEKRLIYTEPTSIFTKTGKKYNGSLLYTIRPIADAKQYHYEQQLINLETQEKARKQAA